MKKTRGKKKTSSSHKVASTKKSFKSFNPKDHILLYVTIAILLICGVLLFFSNLPTGNAVTGNIVVSKSMGSGNCGVGVYSATPIDCGDNRCATVQSDCNLGKPTNSLNILEQPVSDLGETIINFFNVGVTADLGIGKTWKDLIIALIVFVILLAGMYNILMLVSIFDEGWVIWIMAIGLSVIAALSGLVRGITIFLIKFAAGFGALGIVLEIIISIGIFIGLSFGGSKVAQWSAKRQANKIIAKATRGIGKIRAGVRTIKAAGEEAANDH